MGEIKQRVGEASLRHELQAEAASLRQELQAEKLRAKQAAAGPNSITGNEASQSRPHQYPDHPSLSQRRYGLGLRVTAVRVGFEGNGGTGWL